MEGVVEFWELLKDLDARGNLPHDIYAMEIGVGSGARARLWLDRFQAFDNEKGHQLLLAAEVPARATTRPRRWTRLSRRSVRTRRSAA
jgi:hypothetical protein